MTRNDYFLAAALGAIYVVLIGLLSSITSTWGDFISSDDFWGRSNAHAVAYMQIFHSIGVVLAALLIGSAISWRYGNQWLRPTIVASLIASSFMLFDQLRGAWYLSQHNVPPEPFRFASGAVDVVKVAVILLILAAVLGRVFARARAKI